jgi:hypothetical protein
MQCEKCDVQHDGSYASGRFCSAKCSRSFSTSKVRAEINRKVSITLSRTLSSSEGYVCAQCELHFEFAADYRIHKREAHKRVFENIRKDGTRKIWLIRERGHVCEICRITEWQGKPVPLELDHIDGHPDHNDKTNLRVICPNCHAQTPFHKGANVGRHGGTLRQKVMAKYSSYR